MSIFPDPPARAELEPFATVFIEIMVPEAMAGGWFRALCDVPEHDMRRISRRIQDELTTRLGRSMAPAIYVHALLVCGHLFCKAAEMVDCSIGDDPFSAIEAGVSLAKSLVLHHHLDDLYLASSL